MKLKCKQFNSDLTIGKIYEVDENDPISYNLTIHIILKMTKVKMVIITHIFLLK